MGLLLFIIASIIKWAIAPFSYVYGSIAALIAGNGEFHRYNMDLAIAKDQYGNVICQYVFNHLLIKKTGYKFGNADETVSSVIGKNKLNNTLTFLGRTLDNILDFFDENHSVKSIDNTEGNDSKPIH